MTSKTAHESANQIISACSVLLGQIHTAKGEELEDAIERGGMIIKLSGAMLAAEKIKLEQQRLMIDVGMTGQVEAELSGQLPAIEGTAKRIGKNG